MQLLAEESCGIKLCISFLIEASKKVFLYVLFNKYCVLPLKHRCFDQNNERPSLFSACCKFSKHAVIKKWRKYWSTGIIVALEFDSRAWLGVELCIPYGVKSLLWNFSKGSFSFSVWINVTSHFWRGTRQTENAEQKLQSILNFLCH